MILDHPYDYVPDSYSMELLLALIMERIWSRIQTYLKARDSKLEKQKILDEKKNDANIVDNRIDRLEQAIASNKTDVSHIRESIDRILNKLIR